MRCSELGCNWRKMSGWRGANVRVTKITSNKVSHETDFELREVLQLFLVLVQKAAKSSLLDL